MDLSETNNPTQGKSDTPFALLCSKRRSVRRFSEDRKLTQDELVDLLRPALLAPSSKGKQAVDFVLVDDEQLLDSLAGCKEMGASFLRHAALAIVVVGRADLSDVWIEDASVAATTLLYAAEDLGLGACWVQIRERYAADGSPADEIVSSLLTLPAYANPVAVVGVGIKQAEKAARNPEEVTWERVHFGEWSE